MREYGYDGYEPEYADARAADEERRLARRKRRKKDQLVSTLILVIFSAALADALFFAIRAVMLLRM